MVDIRIDTSNLTGTMFKIPESNLDWLDWNELTGAPTLSLEPGEYGFQQFGMPASFRFTVTPDGLVAYDDAYEAFLGGRGTSTLQVKGYPIKIDGTALSHDLKPTLEGVADLSRFHVHELVLAPATAYSVLSAGGIKANFDFNVELDGQVTFNEAYARFAMFQEGTLTIHGYPITIDGRALSQDLLPLLLGVSTSLARDRTHELTLIPGAGYSFQTGAIVPDFQFELTPDGRLTVDPRFASFAEVAGNTLKVKPKLTEGTEPEFQYLVRGQVLYRRGLPIPGLTVRAFHRELRTEIELGVKKTDENGNFEIYYNPNQNEALARVLNNRPPDVFVRVYEAASEEGQEEKLLIESPTEFAAQSVIKFRLKVDGGATKQWSEYEQLAQELKPYLGDLRVADLVEDEKHQDVSLLAGKLAQEPSRVATFIAAHKMAAEVNGNPEVFYALIRKGLPTNLPELLAVSPGTRSRALVGAVRDQIAPGKLADQISEIRQQFDEHAVTFAAADKETAGRPRLGALLKSTLTDQGKVDALVAKILTHTGPTTQLWDALTEDPQFTEMVPHAQLTLQLTALTGRHLPLMKTLLEQQRERNFTSVTEFAAFSEQDWLAYINAPGIPEADRVPPSIPGKDAEKAQIYAATIVRIIADTMPTQVLAYKAQADANQLGDVKVFWKNVTSGAAGFELGRGHVRPYLDNNPALLEGIGDKEAVIGHLEETQRLFNLTRSYDEQQVLRSAGLSSSLAVARLGQGAFLQKLSGTTISAQNAVLIYEKAARVSVAALDLMTQYSPSFNTLVPRVLAGPSVKQIPNLETLFGTFNLCDCEQCRSVHSPAAYFADLMAFLGDRASTELKVPGDPSKGFKTAREILFERRPDLGEIELTCANTNTVLPYTDLVNEILDRRIAPFAPFDLPAAAEADLNAKSISPAVHAAFGAKQIELTPNANVVVGIPSVRWSITDGSVLYSIAKNGASVTVSGAWPQTGASAASLAAVPEHVNSAAYAVLRAEVFPWSLPLDLPTEETRLFLEHLGSPRHELMGELFVGGSTAALDDVATAAEFLGLSDAERQCVTGTVNPARQSWEYWGLQQNGNIVRVFDSVANDFVDKPLGWLESLTWVRQVLRRSGLEYDELVRVLGCEFVNPNLTVRIVSSDPNELATCDTAKLTLTNLTQVIADKLTRFVRLWRNIGGEPENLDHVLIALCGSRIDDAAILKLSHVTRLRVAFGRNVDELVALWALIPTNGQEPLYRRLFLNPDVLTPIDPAFTLDAGNELAIVVGNPVEAKVSKHTTPILAALRISAADLAALQAAGVANDDNLTLANLSALYRHAFLAQCLDLTVPDLLLLKLLAGINPFDPAATADTQRFVDLVAKVRQSGVEIADVGYLLFHRAPETAALAPSLGAPAELISEIRRQLKVIRDATVPRPDPAGDHLRRELAALKWPAAMVDEVVAAIGGTVNYTTVLDPAPPGFAVPQTFVARLLHDPVAKTLTLIGPLRTVERDTLKAAFAPQNYKDAVDDLFAQPRTFAQTRMRAYSWPTVSAPLAALPVGLTFPPALRSRISFDPAAQRLSFDGTINALDKAALDALSPDAAYRAATAALLTAADAFVPAGDNQFVTAAIANTLFDQPQPADGFVTILAQVLGRKRASDGTRLIVRLVADAVGLKYRLADRLLMRDLPHPTSAGKKAIDAFLEEPFAASDPDVPPTETAFPAPFEITLRMMKIAAMVGAMKLSDRVIDWLGDLAAAVPSRQVPWGGGAIQAKWLAFTDLPANAQPIDPVRFAAWLRLCDLGHIGAGLPGGEVTAETLFLGARRADVTAESLATRLATLTGWEVVELTALTKAIGLTLPQDMVDEHGLARLRDTGRRLQRLGTNTAQAQAWVAAAPDSNAGIAARRAVQASYAADQWPDAIRPLEEKLREKRRAALVAYLVVRPDAAQGEAWTDTNGMYSHLLIDVETHPVVLTSRLKQAIGSTQLFVQRCLMNLEPDVIADESNWRQWAWMKQYRVWEANRKIFLYPENWVEPELRDDKSPFFRELENALLQSDVTSESAEQAYITYLARLDEVARLEVAGVFHQPGEGGTPDEYHVFARTHADPPTYFYRKWVGQARWTPWQRLDLDIPGGQILPLIWNRRLYLFWPLFTRKVEQPPTGDKPVEGKPYFEIQLAWSEYRQGRWGTKKTTPVEATLKSRIRPDPALKDEGRGHHVFRATTGGAELQIWYESTESVSPQVDKYGTIVSPGGAVETQGWRFSGCNGRITVFRPYNVGVFPPPNTQAWGMVFREGRRRVYLNVGEVFVSDGTLHLAKGVSGTDSAVALRRTPGNEPFRLLAPHQEQYLTGHLPFFFYDDAETLFVVPREGSAWIPAWTFPERIDPKAIDIIDHIYYQPDLIPHPIGPIDERWDPVPVIRYEYTTTTEDAIASVAEDLAKPIVPALATGKLALATQARKDQLKSIKGTQGQEFVAIGDRKMVTISDYLRPDRIFLPGLLGGHSVAVRRYEFRTHYHPYVCYMISELNLSGLNGLLRRSTQLQQASTFETRYGPTDLVEIGDPSKKDKYPVEDVDFDFDGAYAGYNWELFFHAPLLIACKLMQNQRFEEAQKWFHAIFDPTDVSSAAVPAKYWQTKPFYEQQDYLKQRIDKLLEALAKGQPDEDLSRQLSEWVANPFRPFAVARVRTVAFQKTVVMKYLDNLIAWGDQLFRRDTIESINEATQLYILAAEILGPRPPVIAPRATPVTHTFNTLAPQFAALTNKLTDIEVVLTSPRVDAVLALPDSPPLPVPHLLYFCVPPNDKLLKYWDTVADRLFKIRNSLNLAGIRRTLPLFEPPIDPMLLVKAAAAGVDLSTAIADLAAPAPLYRFQILVQKAGELCQDVKALGAALLAALERRDAEELSRIQTVHEVALLKRVTAVKEDQIKDATAQIKALQAARELAAERYRHYISLLGASPTVPAEGTAPVDAQAVAGAATLEKDGVKMIAQESNALDQEGTAKDWRMAASIAQAAAALGSMVPSFRTEAAPWGVGVGAAFGGQNLAGAANAAASVFQILADAAITGGSRASRLAEFIMRAHNWKLEANLAAREIARIDKDLAAARIRQALSTKERDNHLKQIEENEKVEEFLRTKYTNRELYDWMVGQISAVYFQAYQLAYDTARRAERAFRRELAVPDTDFVRFGYWDSLRKGLLAGERLLHDVRRMEVAYLDQNAREYEITKNVSIASLHPEGLLALHEKGACFIDLPEAIFDLDHPGHYLRRIKAVTITIPCVTGPYTSVPCKLTLLANRTRVDPRLTPQYALTGSEDQRFEFNAGGIRSVVTSTGRDDPAGFELNLRDERYLPFEGAGVISSWRLELPAEFRPFDYRTISDVVLHIRYTAREGGEMLRDAATKKLVNALKDMEVERGRAGLLRGFSGRYEFPDAWQAFAHMPDGQVGNNVLTLPITADRFPAFTSGRSIKVTRILVALVPAPEIAYEQSDPVTLTLTPPTGAAQALTLNVQPNRAGGLPFYEIALPTPISVAAPKPGDPTPTPWKLEMTHISANLARTVTVNDVDISRIDPGKVSDVGILCAYTL